MKISSNFFVQDFVPKIVFTQFGDNAIWFVSDFQITYAEFLVRRWGKKIIINNWKDGGVLENRGTRTSDTLVGGKMSQHKFKSALDINVEGISPEEIDRDIKSNFILYSGAGLTTIEDIVFTTGKVQDDLMGWNHGDNRKWSDSVLHIVKPS